MQALGRFTVKWSQKGTIQYACWFSYSPHYFKCVNGIRGIKIESENDSGVLICDDYLYFQVSETPNPIMIDPATLSTFLALPTPFFVKKYIENDNALRDSAQKTIYKDDSHPPRF